MSADTTPESQGLHTVPDKGSALYLGSLCLVASLGGLLFGFDTAVISGTVEFVRQQFQLTELQVGWFVGSALYGCIIGALIAGALGRRFGRKSIRIGAGFFFVVSALFSTIPPSFTLLIPARLIGGVGVGMASVLAPMYISEFAPPHLRGRLVALYQLSIVIGILAAYFSNWSLLRFSESYPNAFGDQGVLHWTMAAEVWRGMFGAEMIPAALFVLLLFLVPESPRWLIEAGRDPRGFEILARIGGTHIAQRQVTEIKDALAHEEGTILELFKPPLRIALFVGVGLSFFGQLTGVNIVIYYGPELLKAAGFAIGERLQFQVAFGVINLVFTLVALCFIDRWGRRPLLIGGMTAVVASLVIIACLFLLGSNVGVWIALVLGIYLGCLALSINAVIWVLSPEIFPNRVRGRAMSIATFTNWTTNAATASLFLWYVDRFGMHTGFFTFAAICLVATIFFWKLVPETKAKTLEEIEKTWTM